MQIPGKHTQRQRKENHCQCIAPAVRIAVFPHALPFVCAQVMHFIHAVVHTRFHIFPVSPPLFCMRHILIHVFIEFLQHLLLPQDLLQKLIFLRPAFFQFLPDPCRFLYLKTVFRQGFLFYLLFSFDLITHGIVHLSFSIINGIHLFVKFCSSISYITELFFS